MDDETLLQLFRHMVRTRTFDESALKLQRVGRIPAYYPCAGMETQAITGERKQVHRIDQVKCMRCGTCVMVYPPKVAAVEKHSPIRAAAS